MKNFLRDVLIKAVKNLLALLVSVGVLLLVSSLLLAMFADDAPEIPDNGVLYIDLDRVVRDAPADLPTEERVQRMLQGTSEEPLHLRALLETLENAARDDRIKAVYLESGSTGAALDSNFPNLIALRNALNAFKAADKPVFGWFDWAMLPEFILLRSTSELFMEPTGGLFIGGLGTERFYLAEAFEKYGIGVQTAVAGDYKSATESFTRESMSDFDREQTRLFLTALWEGLANELVADGNLSREALETAASTPVWINSTEAAKLGLVNALEGRPEVFAKLVDLAGSGDLEGEPAWVDLETYAAAKLAENPTDTDPSGGRGIALIYVEGVIVDGEGSWDEAGARRISRYLREARFDEDVAAVVMRVNSPGGSVTASEMIQRETRLLQQAGKPVVFSFGGLAASGGYWIATAADSVISEPLCLTGSIGVWGMMLNFKELAAEHGIHFDREKTHPDGGFLSATEPLNEAQMKVFQQRIDGFYDDFLRRVSEARKLPRDELLPLAGGHIWSGKQALAHQLVDSLGTLDDALATAASLANLSDDFVVLENPQSTFGQEWWEPLLQGGLRVVGPLLPHPDPLTTSLSEPLRQAAKITSEPLHIRAQLPYSLHLAQPVKPR